MKRTIASVTALAIGIAWLSFGGQASAQQPGAPSTAVQAPAQTRIAFINVAYVFQKYNKAAMYKNEMEAQLKPRKQEVDKLKEDVMKYSEALQKPGLTPQQKESYEKYIIHCRRQVEDKTKEMQQAFLKKMEEQTVQIYKEVDQVVRLQASQLGFHVVFAFAEPIEGDLYSLANINRKVQGMDLGGGVNPMYFHPGLDISQSVVNTLNAQHAARGGSAVQPVGNFQK